MGTDDLQHVTIVQAVMEAAKALLASEILHHALRYIQEQRVKIHGTSLKQGIPDWYG